MIGGVGVGEGEVSLLDDGELLWDKYSCSVCVDTDTLKCWVCVPASANCNSKINIKFIF